MVPNTVFLTKGVGTHRDKLQSFELALRDAGIEKCNLVQVSSIFPPKCKIISRTKGVELIQPGQITYTVLAKNQTNEGNRLLVASIGIAVPAEKTGHGYISEYHSFGENANIAGDYSEDLAATMLATTQGIEFDPETAWDERKQVYKASGKVYKSMNITQSARGKKDSWTTVIAAVIFLEL
ncbi:arginine decarboxylase, pyruvoyl-dependent [candidate division KSB1 bacterium]|nr:arginine decarboxylase, pyruvoyl-dependent [candidate division KSB1 bacterium]